jgi:hypothetical protein
VSDPYQLFNQLVDFYDIKWSGHVIEDYLDVTLFNPVASTIEKLRTFLKVDVKLAPVKAGPLHVDRSLEDG